MILRAALEEFNKYGFTGASIRRICKASGVTNGRLYHHFENKAELYLACAERYYKMLSNHMQRFELSIAETLEENSMRLYTHWQDFWRMYPETNKLFIQLRINPPAEIALALGAVRRETYLSTIKTLLLDMYSFFYPNDPDKQAFLTAVWISVLDYTLLGIGLQKADLYANMEDWMRSQARIFHKMLCAFLYGVNSEEFTEMRRKLITDAQDEVLF